MDQQFSLSWNNFHGNLTKGFAGLLGNGEFVDVTIAVEGHLLQAHKVILSICSPYFKKMFQMNPCQHPIVVLRDVTHKAMRDLLQFMYHGEVSVKREDLTSFIGTAEVLQIKGLTNKETEEDVSEKEPEQELKHGLETQNNPQDSESIADTFNSGSNEDVVTNMGIELMKQKEFLEKLQKLSQLKRKSDEFISKSYYADLINTEKRPRMKEKLYDKQNCHNMVQNSNYENLKNLYEESPLDISSPYKQQMNLNKEINDRCKEQPASNTTLEIKTECDDMDIIVTDPAVCSTPKGFNESRDGKKDLSPALDYQSPQDNCTSLNSLFTDLKNLVNGKVPDMMQSNTQEYPRQVEHQLITIPQKEDGKKKYPQRSCRLCWKIGKRRDTRFMCSGCELPFCKSPCFQIHYIDILKVSQFQGDYYAT